jgi:hypothetical protein
LKSGVTAEYPHFGCGKKEIRACRELHVGEEECKMENNGK